MLTYKTFSTGNTVSISKRFLKQLECVATHMHVPYICLFSKLVISSYSFIVPTVTVSLTFSVLIIVFFFIFIFTIFLLSHNLGFHWIVIMLRKKCILLNWEEYEFLFNVCVFSILRNWFFWFNKLLLTHSLLRCLRVTTVDKLNYLASDSKMVETVNWNF